MAAPQHRDGVYGLLGQHGTTGGRRGGPGGAGEPGGLALRAVPAPAHSIRQGLPARMAGSRQVPSLTSDRRSCPASVQPATIPIATLGAVLNGRRAATQTLHNLYIIHSKSSMNV
jgi:hypothetical protein